MKSIDLLAAHMIGDYVLQTNEEAVGKFDSPKLRLAHVLKYTAVHAAVGVVHKRSAGRLALYIALTALSHYITDSRRWASGEEWPPKPILVDQAIHATTIALIGRVL